MSYAVRRPVENVFLVRERDRRRTRELLALSLAALPPMVVLFGAIWANLETVRLGYQLASLTKQHEVLVVKNRQLQMQEAQASALSRVEKVARERLGLVPPTLDQLVLVRDETLASSPPLPAPRKALRSPDVPGSTEEGF
jgi:cell division protein FtsL